LVWLGSGDRGPSVWRRSPRAPPLAIAEGARTLKADGMAPSKGGRIMTGTQKPEKPQPGTPQSGKRDKALLNAWWALAFVPVGFFAAFAVGEGLMSAMGYEPGVDEPPGLQTLIISVAALIPYLVAPLLSLRWALIAHRQGYRAGTVTAAIAGALAVAFPLQMLIAAFVG